MPERLDLEGKKLGRLIVSKFQCVSPRGRSVWECRCDCGKTCFVWGIHLKSGHTTSCGCLQKERTVKALIKHGMSHTPEWAAYRNARQRCTNKKLPCYTRYGGRGIKFKFRNFQEFLSALGKKPDSEKRLSVDRINNNGHYEKGNVRWATCSEQMLNTRRQERH